jgi:signal transduction histidine kinase
MQITGRTLRLHLLAYSTLTLLLTLGLIVVVAWFPYNHKIMAGIEQSMRHDAELRAALVDESIRSACELAWQISSRTDARETTAQFDRGMISLIEAGKVLQPQLRDAVEFSSSANGLLRLDRLGQVMVRIGSIPLDSLANLRAKYFILEQAPVQYVRQSRQSISSIFYLNKIAHILVFTPVYSPDQREIAQDLLLYRIDTAVSELSAPLTHGEDAICLLMGKASGSLPVDLLLQVGQSPLDLLDSARLNRLGQFQSAVSHVSPDGDMLFCISPLRTCPWWLGLGAQRHVLIGEPRTWLMNILLTVLGLGLSGLLGSLVLMRPLRDKILVAQNDLRHQVAEMENVKGKLEAQSERLLERNEDLRHFAFASAHDMKSPLISIGGHAQMLLDRLGPELPAERRQSLEFILAGSKRMFQHVNDMLDYSRAAEIEPRLTVVSIDRICQEILSSLDGRIRESKAIVRLHNLPKIYGDRRLLRMILQNLIDNALCYRQPDLVPEVDVLADCSPDDVVIRVKDNGLGISPDHQPQIFDTFYRLHDETKIPGTGLGLAICLRAVRRLEGSIELESEPGRGSCFTIRLPQPPIGSTSEEGDEATIA